ncbi:MAG: hypothetical protein JWL95_2048 [Gemmatimonadetes bacterium]|nr:hypothetical protein [Gemmatimonadota bacterium]
MAIELLSPDTQLTIRRTLAFISTTRYLDGEFETRMGIDRGEVAAVLMRWPAVDDHADDSPAAVAINNALNEVVNGLALSADDWHQLGASRAAVEAAYAEWATARGWASTGLQ